MAAIITTSHLNDILIWSVVQNYKKGGPYPVYQRLFKDFI